MGGYDLINATALMPDGRIILAGRSSTDPYGEQNQYTVVRLMPNGEFDPGFGANGILSLPQTLPNVSANSVFHNRSGSILVLGRTYTVDRAFGGTLLRLVGDPDSDGDGFLDGYEVEPGSRPPTRATSRHSLPISGPPLSSASRQRSERLTASRRRQTWPHGHP